MHDLNSMNSTIGFIGAGNMNSAIIGGLIKSGMSPEQVIVSNPSNPKLTHLAETFGVKTTSDNKAVAEQADVIIIGVKPHYVADVCAEISDLVSNTLIISVAAGVSMLKIAEHFTPSQAIIRVMPNTPSLVGKGATGLCPNPHASSEQTQMAKSIFETVGITEVINDEALMDLVTAISGSGPAYFFYIIEAMVKEAVQQGMPEEQAKALIYQTAAGAAEMLQQSDLSPEQLRKNVTSPGGTTAAALDSLTQDDVSRSIQRAVVAAVRRGNELGK